MRKLEKSKYYDIKNCKNSNIFLSIFYPAYTLIAYFERSSAVSMSPVRISPGNPGGLFAELQQWGEGRGPPSISSIPVRGHTQHINLQKNIKQYLWNWSYLYRKSDLCIPINETVRPRSQFLHSCFCGRFIYSQDQSDWLQQNRQSDTENI